MTVAIFLLLPLLPFSFILCHSEIILAISSPSDVINITNTRSFCCSTNSHFALRLVASMCTFVIFLQVILLILLFSYILPSGPHTCTSFSILDKFSSSFIFPIQDFIYGWMKRNPLSSSQLMLQSEYLSLLI